MTVTGIICEYDPLHLGHQKQLDRIRAAFPEGAIVCLMSGNYVQRGKPAIIDKSLRAQAAVFCGADLVLELPVTASLSSAEGFAAAGVRILGKFCDRLCFGAEDANADELLRCAKAALSDVFREKLLSALSLGLSFPAARQQALQEMGINPNLVCKPNNILAVEYCKAIISQNTKMTPYPIFREGAYHDSIPDPQNPSATAVRQQMRSGDPWLEYIPESARPIFAEATVHTLEAGERAVLAKLRCMSEDAFESLPYGSEGLWRKLMHAVRAESTLEDILAATKSKRYTRSRLDRMVMCAFLGLNAKDLDSPAPYVRVLALSDRGRLVLKAARQHGVFPNAGEKMDHPYQTVENRCTDLYGLFAEDIPERAGLESARRITYKNID